MTEEQTNPKQAEYERRRRVWRYANNLPGPQEPPCQADAHWLNGAVKTKVPYDEDGTRLDHAQQPCDASPCEICDAYYGHARTNTC